MGVHTGEGTLGLPQAGGDTQFPLFPPPALKRRANVPRLLSSVQGVGRGFGVTITGEAITAGCLPSSRGPPGPLSSQLAVARPLINQPAVRPPPRVNTVKVDFVVHCHEREGEQLIHITARR